MRIYTSRQGRIQRKGSERLSNQARQKRFGGGMELTIHPKGRKEALTSTVSWWTEDRYRSDRAAFQQKANELHPMNSQYNAIPMSPQARVTR